MRVWIAAAAAATSRDARWIWKNKVMGSTFKRSPKLRQNIQMELELAEDLRAAGYTVMGGH
jgi:hypothetical protein